MATDLTQAGLGSLTKLVQYLERQKKLGSFKKSFPQVLAPLMIRQVGFPDTSFLVKPSDLQPETQPRMRGRN